MKVRGVSAAETTPPRGEAKDFPSDSPGDGTVPHLGAHLAEFTTIAEGNPDYLPQAPHSLNVEKLRLVCRSVKLVARLQTARF